MNEGEGVVIELGIVSRKSGQYLLDGIAPAHRRSIVIPLLERNDQIDDVTTDR